MTLGQEAGRPNGRPQAYRLGPVPSRRAFEGDSVDVAPTLLGMVLAHGTRAGRIVEVEAYRGEADPASHAYRGRTSRNAAMYGRPGLLYVYFTYGMHFCANVVCGPEGKAAAVLLRALEPVSGLEGMRSARAGRRKDGQPVPDRDLCRGPANLTSALGIDRTFDGADLLARSRPHLLELRIGTPVPPGAVAQGPRIGITRATEAPWRFWEEGSPFVSGVRSPLRSTSRAGRTASRGPRPPAGT